MILSVLREKKNQCCAINLGPPLVNVVSMVWAKEMAVEKIDRSARVWPVTTQLRANNSLQLHMENQSV